MTKPAGSKSKPSFQREEGFYFWNRHFPGKWYTINNKGVKGGDSVWIFGQQSVHVEALAL
jgi:hypothetical protein